MSCHRNSDSTYYWYWSKQLSCLRIRSVALELEELFRPPGEQTSVLVFEWKVIYWPWCGADVVQLCHRDPCNTEERTHSSAASLNMCNMQTLFSFWGGQRWMKFSSPEEKLWCWWSYSLCAFSAVTERIPTSLTELKNWRFSRRVHRRFVFYLLSCQHVSPIEHPGFLLFFWWYY